MHVGDSSLSARGQVKVAVDYQENIAAGLQEILETTWNQLYDDGIIANNGDPKGVGKNWFFAAWAYNSLYPAHRQVRPGPHSRPELHRPGRDRGHGLGEQPGEPGLPAQP